MKNFLKIFVAVGIVALMASCASFDETTKTKNTEMMSFQDVSLAAIKVSEMTNLGAVEVSRTVTLTRQKGMNPFKQGDFSIEMDDWSYTYDAVMDEETIEGTRVVGKMKVAQVGEEGSGAGMATLGFAAGLAAMNPMASSGDDDGSSALDARQIAKEAVTYDLLEAVGQKGGMAVMLPQFTWEVSRNKVGNDIPSFFPPLLQYEMVNTQTITYTVTARGTAVSF